MKKSRRLKKILGIQGLQDLFENVVSRLMDEDPYRYQLAQTLKTLRDVLPKKNIHDQIIRTKYDSRGMIDTIQISFDEDLYYRIGVENGGLTKFSKLDFDPDEESMTGNTGWLDNMTLSEAEAYLYLLLQMQLHEDDYTKVQEGLGISDEALRLYHTSIDRNPPASNTDHRLER